MITKKAKLQAEQALLNYTGKYSNKVEIDKTFQKIVTFFQNKTIGIYNWFHYKEAFSKELVHRLIDTFKLKQGDYILDPFCGIGTTLLASREKGINSVGIDIMPLCTFITKTKLAAARLSTKEMEFYLNTLLKQKIKISKNYLIPDIKIIERAFPSKNTFLEIIAFRQLIKDVIKNKLYQNVFLLGLLSIVEKISHTKKDGAFLRIIKKEGSPDIKTLFKSQVMKYILDINNLNTELFENNLRHYNTISEVYCGDIRELPLYHKVNAVITSPPYLNRYDYTRTYALELAVNFVKNFDELKKIRYSTIRSHVEAKFKNTDIVKSPSLIEGLHLLGEKKLNNPKIPEMIKGYFEDMYIVLKKIKSACYNNSRVGFVVGTVRYSGVNFPVDIILAEIGEQLGYELEKIIVTRIKGNSQQQRETYGENPTRESIVILKVQD